MSFSANCFGLLQKAACLHLCSGKFFKWHSKVILCTSSGVSVFRRAAQSVSRGQRSEGAAVCKGRGLLSAQISKTCLLCMMCTVHCRQVFFYAALAQPAEHPAHNRVVAGSIPARGMIYSRSSIGRALVSKTRGCRFKPCRECQIAVLGILQYSRASGGESTGCSSTPPVYVVRETECILGVLLILTFSLK